MRRAPVLLPLALAVTLLGAGCGATGGSIPARAIAKAPPQTATLGWEERDPTVEPALVFGVRSFTVTRDGWSADVSLENRSDVAWRVGSADLTPLRAWGVMLFPSGDLGDLERRNAARDLPGVRVARVFAPALPDTLQPGATWTGTMSAPGALAGGLWVRIVFGPLASVGDPPRGMLSQFVWISDHAHRLEQGAAKPA